MLSDFEKKVAQTGLGEYDSYHLYSESDPGLAERIEQYWTDLGLPFPGVDTAWSAVFVSWCIRQAGASAQEFKFSPQHSVYVHWAIANMEARRGVFRAHPIDEVAPSIGDLIQNNR